MRIFFKGEVFSCRSSLKQNNSVPPLSLLYLPSPLREVETFLAAQHIKIPLNRWSQTVIRNWSNENKRTWWNHISAVTALCISISWPFWLEKSVDPSLSVTWCSFTFYVDISDSAWDSKLLLRCYVSQQQLLGLLLFCTS